jgi:hypothetical protein
MIGPTVGGITGRGVAESLSAQMRPRAHVEHYAGVHDALQSCGAQHDHVVEAFATNGSDEPFDVGVLPGRAWGGHHGLDVDGPGRAGDSGRTHHRDRAGGRPGTLA